MKSNYYLPEPSAWPMIATMGIFCAVAGGANWLHGRTIGPILFGFGFLLIVYILFGWFGTVIRECRAGLLNDRQVDRSFRWCMAWFIFSEVMFFATFFGALFYARVLSVPWLGGSGHGAMTHLLMWPGFKPVWPVLNNPDPNLFHGPQSVMETWGIPAINTAILLTSGLTITVAHWAVVSHKRMLAIGFQLLTVLLGVAFLCMQVHEYTIAYLEKGLTLASGIYGTTFFLLTGFHCLHVTIGTIALIVILWRLLKNDFTPKHHFAFEGVAWYWHFVDVVWLGLFVFVYWI